MVAKAAARPTLTDSPPLRLFPRANRISTIMKKVTKWCATLTVAKNIQVVRRPMSCEFTNSRFVAIGFHHQLILKDLALRWSVRPVWEVKLATKWR